MDVRHFAAALAVAWFAGVALAGDAIVGFSHDNTADISGYYLPPNGTKVSHFVMHNIALGSGDDLKKWEAGKERSDTWAPVMVSFTDLTSKMVRNEERGEMEHADVRVLPRPIVSKAIRSRSSARTNNLAQWFSPACWT